VERLIPFRFRGGWERFAALAPILLLAVIVAGGRVIRGPMTWTSRRMHQIVWSVATAGLPETEPVSDGDDP
jgi:hypothetical protein